ncbi:PAS domain S-box protein [Brevibacillus invocatus]|uniref:sensor histidine kinase n=1 Tax=Brevibacillus invocatus TaxID=173959 RepID=UPI00203BA649|nr:PAS domain S-box protein [Brevibacillus invocatus]MCM3081952.1 PAS domain S-box protein [Brevibacillus invocatus]MCM3432358.1 PAS domain S-box protein [Brevibacillus invocatus]
MDAYCDVIRGAKLLLHHMPDLIYVIDLHDRVLWQNEACKIRFGTLDRVSHDEALRSKQHPIPILSEDGQTIGYTVMVREETSDTFDEKYKIIADNTYDTIVLVDNQAVARYVSPSFQDFSGYSVEEYVGMDAFDIIHPADRERVRDAYIEVVQSNRTVDIGYRIFHAQGSLIHLEARVKPVLGDEGEVKYVVAVVRDVTERKKSEELLDNILDNVNAAVWSTDKDFRQYTFCSESIEKIFGIPKKEIIHNPIRLHDHIHPEDNAILMGEIKEKLDLGIPINQEFRFIHREGETGWGRLMVHPSVDAAGAVERLDGIVLDITDKKRSELALEESEQRYKSLFDHNLDGVFSIELSHFYFVNANQSFEAITGITLDQLPDRCFLGLIYDEDHVAVYETLFQVMEQGEPRDIECRLAYIGNQEKIVSITFVPIFLSGKLNGIHGIVKDITKRKRDEQELIKSEERYKALQQSLNRFSSDLANVMKVSELEERLIEEAGTILPISQVSIEEVPRGMEQDEKNEHDIWIKIGEKKHPVYLRIMTEHSLQKMEKEWLETAVHYVTILYDNLHLLEDLMKRLEEMVAKNETPKWMLRLLFKLSEKERASLSSDLHDSVLQDLIIWYRKLETLQSSNTFSQDMNQALLQITEGLLDVIHQIRITCNELRPPFLLKMGLVESLKSLFSYARMFSNYEIHFSTDQLDVHLNEEQILGVYRIVQELLNNASKHSHATQVAMTLGSTEEHITFSYSDDGVGMDLTAFEGSFQHMGIAGIEKRVLSLEGIVQFHTAPKEGFHVTIRFPKMMMAR